MPVATQAFLTTLEAANLLVDVYGRQSLPLELAGLSPNLDSKPEQSGWLCYRGVKFDPHSRLQEPAALEAPFWIIEDRQNLPPNPPPYLLVRNPRAVWSYFCAADNANPQRDMAIIGITGTNGKTSTAWHVRSLLRQQAIPTLFLGTIGAYLGSDTEPLKHTTPDPPELFRLLRRARAQGIKHVVMEVSSHALKQGKVAPLTFAATAFTSFSRDHLDFHPDMEDYFAAKIAILKQTKPGGLILVNEEIVRNHNLNAALAGANWRTYGASDYRAEADGPLSTRFELLATGASASLPLFGDYTTDNFLAALQLATAICEMPVPAAAWPDIKPVPGRLETIPGPLSVVVDYAHTPDALAKSLAILKARTPGQLWVIFGCGGDRDRGKRPEMAAAAAAVADRVIITSDNPRTEDPEAIIAEIVVGLPTECQYQVIPDRRTAIQFAIKEAAEDDVVLVAGKGHEDYQIIGTTTLPFSDQTEVRQAWPLRANRQET